MARVPLFSVTAFEQGVPNVALLVDDVLLNVARTEMLARMERELEIFVLGGELRHQFGPQSSFVRLVAHRLSHHFGLHHSVLAVPGLGSAVVAFKTPHTSMPPLRLTDLFLPPPSPPPPSVPVTAPEEAAPAARTAPVLLLRRQPQANDSAASTGVPAPAASAATVGAGASDEATLQEREARYLQAKVRIFGKETVEEHAKEDKLEELRSVNVVVTSATPVKKQLNPNAAAFNAFTPKSAPPASTATPVVASKPAVVPAPVIVAAAPVTFAVPRSPPRSPPKQGLPEEVFAPGQVLAIAHVRVAPGAISLTQVLADCAEFNCKYARVFPQAGGIVVVFNSANDAERAGERFGMLTLTVVVSVTDPNGGSGGRIGGGK